VNEVLEKNPTIIEKDMTEDEKNKFLNDLDVILDTIKKCPEISEEDNNLIQDINSLKINVENNSPSNTILFSRNFWKILNFTTNFTSQVLVRILRKEQLVQVEFSWWNVYHWASKQRTNTPKIPHVVDTVAVIFSNGSTICHSILDKNPTEAIVNGWKEGNYMIAGDVCLEQPKISVLTTVEFSLLTTAEFPLLTGTPNPLDLEYFRMKKVRDQLLEKLEGTKREHFLEFVRMLREDDGEEVSLQHEIDLLGEYINSKISYSILTEEEIAIQEDIW
jgi:hypothetical protein